jgi:hypothetical protein
MPKWSNELPVLKKHMGFDLKRTPETAPLQAIVTCEDILVCDTHYWGGRTIPCEREAALPDGTITAGNCAPCRESMPYRTHVYVSCFDWKTREHFIFECTSHAAKPLEDYKIANKTLRGCIIRSQRPKGQKNSKVVIETNTANLAKNPIPLPPDLILALSTIWRLPTAGLRSEKKRHQNPQLKCRKQVLDAMREQPDNQPDPQTVGEILSPTGNGNGSRFP